MKSILIIGASSDLGIALISEIYERYDTIYAHCNTGAAALSQFGERVRILRADLSSEAETARLFEGISPPDDFVHLAARPIKFEKLQKLGWGEFEAEMNVSLRSAYLAMTAFLPAMQRRGGGHAIFAASSVTLRETKYLAAYTAAKCALVGLVRAASAEYPALCINAISPAMFDSKFLDAIPRIAIEKAAKDARLGRLLTPCEVAKALCALLSDDKTGENILVE